MSQSTHLRFYCTSKLLFVNEIAFISLVPSVIDNIFDFSFFISNSTIRYLHRQISRIIILIFRLSVVLRQ
ncbi:hypothetical protein PUN28_004719 [Cardiocondyla obscurior]|uniref:Uncharacterized protein n=1 Tax=Cardiocondyla obscurior TaxID=286306 RepID=A0AAW2GF26_9HYME